MARRNPLARNLTLYSITVEAHTVVGTQTYEVPERTFRLGGKEQSAKIHALSRAQREAGVPLWLPYRRQGWKYVKATKEDVELPR